MTARRLPYRIAALLAKLDHGAASDFSTCLRPDDCAYLAAELRRPPSKRKANR